MAQTQCTRTFTIPEGGHDMALDQAIYSSSQNKIFGVRGQWIYKFNATTGAKESEYRFINGVLSESSITEVGGFLYVGTWHGVLWNLSGSLNRNGIDVYRINYALNSSTPLGLNIQAGFSPSLDWRAGFTNLVNDGTNIWGISRFESSVFVVNPSNVATYTINPETGNNNPLYDLVYDPDHLVVWLADWDYPTVQAQDMVSACHANPTTMYQVLGLTRVPSSNRLYAVIGNQEIIRVNGNAAFPGFNNFTWTSLGSILGAGATPVKIKYNPVDGLIYIPTWGGDTVEILNPGTETITAIKTGFSSPFDVCFTPTKKWAVQNSSRGLSEII